MDDAPAAATCRSRCPASGSTPSPWASPAEIQRARRTGLTFAPEAGTWRMRQVINKLISEEDLYGAVESAYQPGLAPDEALLPHRPAHRDRRGHAGHRRAGPQLRRARPEPPQEPVGDRVGRRLRAQAVHAVPVVRPEHAGGAAPQGRPAPRRPPARPRACSSSGTTRRPAWSRASVTAATAASARSSRTCGATAGIFQEWSEHFDMRLWTDAMERHGLDHGLVRAPAPPRGRGLRLGPPLGRPAQGLPLAGLARRARTRSASRTAGGRPATTAAPAPATASSTSSPRPCRPPAAARAPARASPRGGAVPVAIASPAARRLDGRRAVVMRRPLPLHQAGKVRFTSHRDVARLWERALRRAGIPLVYSEGFSPRPQAAFGLALPTGHESDGEYLDLDLLEPGTGDSSALPALLTAMLPDGHRRDGRGTGGHPGTPSLQEAVGACTWTHEVIGPTAHLAEAAIDGGPGPQRAPARAGAQGQGQVVDLRPAIHELDRDGATATGVELGARLGTRPRGLGRPARSAPGVVRLSTARGWMLRSHRKDAPMDHRRRPWREPVPTGRRPLRTPRRVRHEKGRFPCPEPREVERSRARAARPPQRASARLRRTGHRNRRRRGPRGGRNGPDRRRRRHPPTAAPPVPTTGRGADRNPRAAGRPRRTGPRSEAADRALVAQAADRRRDAAAAAAPARAARATPGRRASKPGNGAPRRRGGKRRRGGRGRGGRQRP